MKKEVAIKDFQLPTYSDIPEMGLYLKQVVDYLNQHLAPLGNLKLTNSMVSNYVKHKLITPPQSRLYQREQIATLFFIAIAKNVMDQEDLRKALAIQKDTYPIEVAYDYFAKELKNVLLYVFDQQEQLQKVGHDHTKQKQMLRNVIMAFAYREYLYQFFREV
ncbi:MULTISPECIES: DUF1836 domain-containing protein [Lactobacillus]|uniref:DUF1836 domain-containing protein n=1 Tax=Lactobacillus xujianguonis TaxID=2495899 RepID=A0A437SV16_9LACO|nr:MULTISPECIES: DUF1836 domain-containing protein [Lactobacillus]RVU70781.1 DUF1836 domain-containing protein [Lactobacillus xujianguonis]RVU73956.1 DUF1836 domain-containing protein [Lactobacillus xujianguonis]